MIRNRTSHKSYTISSRVALYCVGFSLLIVKTILLSTYAFSTNKEIDFVFDALVLASLSFVFCKILKTNFSKKTFVFLGVLIFMGVINTYCTKTYVILIDLLFILAAYKVDFRKIVKTAFYCTFCTVTIVILLFAVHVLPGNDVHKGLTTLGFHDTNGLCQLLVVTFASAYLLFNKKHINLLLIPISLISYFVFSCRSAAIAGTLFFAMSCLVPSKPNKFFYILTRHSFPILFVLTSCVVLLPFDSSYIRVIDLLLSQRLTFTKYAIENCGITLLGNDISNFFKSQVHLYYGDIFSRLILDNGYTKFIVQYGILFGVFFTYIYIKIIDKAYENKNYKLMVISFIFSTYIFMESQNLSICYGFFWLYYLSDDRNRIENTQNI